MPTYVISSHGEPRYDAETRVPGQVSVRFYQPFGQPMYGGHQLQSALMNPAHPQAPDVLAANRQCALWNEGKHKPSITLWGDNRTFRTGLLCAELNTVVRVIDANERLTLEEALDVVRKHAQQHFPQAEDAIVVHCLFCL